MGKNGSDFLGGFISHVNVCDHAGIPFEADKVAIGSRTSSEWKTSLISLCLKRKHVNSLRKSLVVKALVSLYRSGIAVALAQHDMTRSRAREYYSILNK